MTPVPVRLGFSDDTDRNRVVVEWLMSSVCNYSCSYCPTYLHDGRTRFPRFDDTLRFAQKLREHYRGWNLTFLLTGGEVTLYRDLKRLATELKGFGADVAILTNGSRPLDWWRSHLGLFDEVIISYHHEHADDDHLLAVAAMLSEECRIQINVVVDPRAFDRTMSFAARAETETQAVVNRKIMFEDGWKRRTQYGPDQQSRLDAALESQKARTAGHSRRTVLKGDLRMEFDDGAQRDITAFQIVNEGLNQWTGWSCAIGENTLFVRFDEVWRGVCRVGGRVGSIYDDELDLPTGSVHCTLKSCNCMAGMKAPKERPALAPAAPGDAQPGLRANM